MFENGNKLSTGRKKGTPNRLNIDIRQKFYQVYDTIGHEEEGKSLTGDESFRAWARLNKKTFYSLFCKLAPTNIDISDNRQHESFIDRMTQTMLEAEAKVIESKVIDTQSQLQGIPSPSKQIPMGKDDIISPSNGGYMGDNDTDDTNNNDNNSPSLIDNPKKLLNGDPSKG